MHHLVNILVGFMVFVRAAVIASLPLGVLAGIYYLFVYGVWSNILSAHYQHGVGEMSWILSAVSMIAIGAALFGLHELGRIHRRKNPRSSKKMAVA